MSNQLFNYILAASRNLVLDHNQVIQILAEAENATELVNYIETEGEHAGKSVLWLACATGYPKLITYLINRTDLSSESVNAIAESGDDQGKSVVWMIVKAIMENSNNGGVLFYDIQDAVKALLQKADLAGENINAIAARGKDLGKSALWLIAPWARFKELKPEFRAMYLSLLQRSNPTAINSRFIDRPELPYAFPESVLMRAAGNGGYVMDSYKLCKELLLRGANIEKCVQDIYRDLFLCLRQSPGSCEISLNEDELFNQDLEKKLNDFVSKSRIKLATARFKLFENNSELISDIIQDLAFIIARSLQTDEDSNVKSKFIFEIGSNVIKTVCSMINETLNIYNAKFLTTEQLQTLHNFLKILSIPAATTLINYLQNIPDAPAPNLLQDVTKNLSGAMLYSAKDKVDIMNAFEVTFAIRCLDRNDAIIAWRSCLATSYVQHDLTKEAIFEPQWDKTKLQGSFADVAHYISEYKKQEPDKVGTNDSNYSAKRFKMN